ncbi:MAG TPA: hypothetical protein VGD10_06175 [Allosphingosinicella sp.]|uniref:hypothetical protein n=1 Tax=Allosphingosinicella sp. TaxID=2823234 RepID=UPI002ED88806
MDAVWGEFPADVPADDTALSGASEDPRERRLQIRAYNHWVSILNGRDFPSIDDLDLNAVDFGRRSFVLDCTMGIDNPAITFIGSELREASQIGYKVQYIQDIPRRSLLSRLTDHYLQIIANRAPVGFEAEFEDDHGVTLMYRGILMPFSSDGDSIDFLYGVINWKEGCEAAAQDAGAELVLDQPAAERAAQAEPEDLVLEELVEEISAPQPEVAEEPLVEALELGEDAALADRLSVAREGAQVAKSADARSRAALYEALGLAYDFALAAEAEPEDYAEMLEDAGVKMQARAPMTPVVKLVFGIEYDKARLTEFAAALTYGRRQDVPMGAFDAYLAGFPGGLKGMVAAERAERNPAPAAANEDIRDLFRTSAPLAHLDLDAPGGDFVLLVARREADGSIAVVAPVAADDSLVERAMRKAVVPEASVHAAFPKSRAA